MVVYDIVGGHASITSYGEDCGSAVEAYNEVEQKHREDPNVEVVLLGSDSVETLDRTHSSYFELREQHIDQIVARELAERGLR